LTIEWLYSYGEISSVYDVPDDQGGQIRLQWRRSGADDYAVTNRVTDYFVYRRVDSREIEDSNHKDGYFSGDRWPDGVWDFVTQVPAFGEDEYAVVVPTLVDSTEDTGAQYSVFFLRALTEDSETFYDSPPDSGYSVDNLAPNVPQNFRFDSGTLLVWDESEDEDFRYFSLYGSDLEEFNETVVLIDHTIGTSYDVGGQTYSYYHLTATDFAGNESNAATEGNTTDVECEILPGRSALYSNYPNPFSSTTQIRFDLPNPTAVTMTIYDVSGRIVRRLLKGEIVAAGRHQIQWNGKTDSGHRVKSGIFYYKFNTNQHTRTRRMVLLE
jgi:hypothetical protein